MKTRRFAAMLTLFVLLCARTHHLWPQALENAITGSVHDASGAVVIGAKITVTNVATNVSHVYTSDNQGIYVIPSLLVGQYTVEAQTVGFKTNIHTGVIVQADKSTRVDFVLEIGNLAQSVEVTSSAAAPIMRTEDASLGAVIDQTQKDNLPLNGRDFVSLAQLVPGANAALAGNQNGLGRTQPLNLSVNGQRQFDNNYRLDGISFIDAFVNGSTFIPSLEIVSEVSVLTGQYSAAYGEYAGAQVNMATKSGTNRIHGSLFEFFGNDVLNARSYFDISTKPALRYNQYGATVGGPITIPKLYNGRNRSFFFFGYQGDATRTGTTFLSAVATPLMRAGNFSELLPKTVIVNPFTGAPYPSNTIPSSMLSPQAQALMAYIPTPNLPGTGVNYFVTGDNADNDNQYYARVDQTISQKDALFGRIAYRKDNFQNVTANPNFRSLGDPSNQNYVISETHIFSPRLINQAEGSYARQSIPTLTGREGSNIGGSTFGIGGLNNTNPLLDGVPTASVSGYLGTGENFANPRLLYSVPAVNDNATLSFGKHTIQFGSEFFRRREDFISVSAPNQGEFIFSGQLSKNAFADFDLGLPYETAYLPTIGQSGIHQRHLSAYIQDDWHVSNRLTLNLGMRYEYAGSYSDVTGHARNFNWSTLLLFPNVGQTVALNDPTSDFIPRIGIAYRASERTVIRSGFGIFTTTPTTANVSLLYTNPPNNAQQTLFTNLSDPNLTLASIETGTTSTAPPGVYSIPYNYGPGYAEEWSLNVQRQLPWHWVAEVGYIGSHTLHLDNAHSDNEPLTPGPGAVQARRPLQQYADIRVFGTDGVSYYDAFDARLQNAGWHGLNLISSYSWSHCLDTKSSAATSAVGTEDQEPQNQYNRFEGERGRCIIDFRQQFHLNSVYAIPGGEGASNFASRAIEKGWLIGIGGIAQTGDAETVIVSGNPANTGRGTIRPNRLCNGNLAASKKTIGQWFETSCFVSAGLYAFGDSSRGIIEGPATKIWNVNLQKSTAIGETQNLLFRTDFYNILNTPQFADPGLTVATPTFGVITSTASPGRQIVFGLRYTF